MRQLPGTLPRDAKEDTAPGVSHGKKHRGPLRADEKESHCSSVACEITDRLAFLFVSESCLAIPGERKTVLRYLLSVQETLQKLVLKGRKVASLSDHGTCLCHTVDLKDQDILWVSGLLAFLI